jgi:replication-associated recombination protein RarA
MQRWFLLNLTAFRILMQEASFLNSKFKLFSNVFSWSQIFLLRKLDWQNFRWLTYQDYRYKHREIREHHDLRLNQTNFNSAGDNCTNLKFLNDSFQLSRMYRTKLEEFWSPSSLVLNLQYISWYLLNWSIEDRDYSPVV